jgi:hypothetical protein
MTNTVLIPTAFARDRYERDLSIGTGRWTAKGYQASLSDDELDDLQSDAAYYADGVDSAPPNIVRAAQTLVRRLGAAQ